MRTSSACDPRKLFVGTLDEGAVCNSNGSGIDCKPGLFCSYFDTPQGVCLAHLKEGDICSANGSWYGECGPQMLCDPQRGVCTQGIAEGQPCAYVAPDEPRGGTEVSACAPGLSCDATRLVCADSRCYAGKSCSQDKECPEGHVCAGSYCKPPANTGESCLEADDCANKDCVYYPERLESFCGGIFPDGSACNGSRQCASGYCKFGLDGFGMCAAQGAVGSECEPGSAGTCLNGQCMYNDGSFTYVCTAAGGEGDACLNAPCRDGFACIEGVCHKPPFADGLSCDSNSACTSGFCSNGMCMTPAPAGTACLLNGDPAQCADGLYCLPSEQLSLTGMCQTKLRQGELCTEHYQCWESCDVIAGKRRCRGVGPTDAWCSGR